MADPLSTLTPREFDPGLYLLVYDPSVEDNPQVELVELDADAGARFVEAINLALGGPEWQEAGGGGGGEGGVSADENNALSLGTDDLPYLSSLALGEGGGAVTSVAGRTGAITLVADDISNASTIGKTILTAADVAAVLSAIGLAAKQTSTGDLTAGRLLINGAHGLGGNAGTRSDFTTLSYTTFFRSAAEDTTGAPSTDDEWVGVSASKNSDEAGALMWGVDSGRAVIATRTGGTWSSWQDLVVEDDLFDLAFSEPGTFLVTPGPEPGDPATISALYFASASDIWLAATATRPITPALYAASYVPTAVPDAGPTVIDLELGRMFELAPEDDRTLTAVNLEGKAGWPVWAFVTQDSTPRTYSAGTGVEFFGGSLPLNEAAGSRTLLLGAVNSAEDAIEFVSVVAGEGGGTAASTTDVLTGTDTTEFATPDAIAALWELGSGIASASEITIGEGGAFDVTGTTTITSIVMGTHKAGRLFRLVFAGALTLTHNATSLILPTGANITTAAGDVAWFQARTSAGQVRCIGYMRASGQPIAFAAASATDVLTGTAVTGAVTADALASLWEQGSNIASGTTISIGEGGYFHVTGTTTITDIDFATDKAGRMARLVFDGALTLTHHATTLILPGGANILTVAGDSCIVVSEGSDAVRVVQYTRAAGVPLSGSNIGTAANIINAAAAPVLVGSAALAASDACGALNGTANMTADLSTAINFETTTALSATRTLAVSNVPAGCGGRTGYFRFVQNGTGGFGVTASTGVTSLSGAIVLENDGPNGISVVPYRINTASNAIEVP